ncbi:MAG: O-antigen ligase family protein [Limnothrix sp.]
MKRLFLANPHRLPLCGEIGIVLFPFAPGWGAILIGIQLILLLKQLGKKTFQHPIARILGAITLWLFFITAIAEYPLESLMGMVNFLPFFLFFLAFSQILNSLERLERLAWLFVAPSLGVSLIGFADLLLGWQTPDLIWHLFGWELTSIGNPPGRMASTFVYANNCAAYLLMVFLLGLGLWLKDFAWHKLTKSKVFIYLTITLLADAAALVLTSSRSVWAIAFFGVLIYALYIGWWWICAFAGGLTAAVLGASFGQTPWKNSLRTVVPYYFWGRLSDQMYGDRPTVDLRSTQWQFVIDMIQQRPLTGWGLRSFTPAYEIAMGRWLGHPHNLYLMLTSEIGIPFAGLLIGTVGWILARGLQTWRSLAQNSDRLILFSYLLAFGGYALFNLLDVTAQELRLNTFAWLLLAGIWGLGQQVNQAGNESQRDGSPEEH